MSIAERKFLKIGHRGAAGHEPENTLISFQRAIELGADMIELDVQLCKSGELVVIHDDTLERTTNGHGRVGEKTQTELKALDAGKGQKISTLDEVIKLVGLRTKINVELKGKGTARPLADLIYRYTGPGGGQNQFLVSSFDIDELFKFRAIDQFSRIGLIFKKLANDIFQIAEELSCYSIHPSVGLTTAELLDEAHEMGLKVFVWTANASPDISLLKAMGVDGIFSDFSDR